MAQDEDLIDFAIIEEHKENITSLPSGRSAKALARLYSPPPNTTPSHTQDLNTAARAEFEHEIELIDESDDPLDVYDRYVRWTLDTYPSASATPQSQLLPLLERATKAFIKSPQYKNDARYLKIWLTYQRLFSDAPRETFAYLARHDVGAGLALYYEEFAAWLELNGRWAQAEEIYLMGMERQAVPVARLTRKFEEFRRRAEDRQDTTAPEPTSPALPKVRPALAAKLDPFTAVGPTSIADPQALARAAAAAPAGPASRKQQKMQVFSDAGDGAKAESSTTQQSKGWESLGSLAERRKENAQAAQPWTGVTLGVGTKQNSGMPKMEIFRDKD